RFSSYGRRTTWGPIARVPHSVTATLAVGAKKWPSRFQVTTSPSAAQVLREMRGVMRLGFARSEVEVRMVIPERARGAPTPAAMLRLRARLRVRTAPLRYVPRDQKHSASHERQSAPVGSPREAVLELVKGRPMARYLPATGTFSSP